MTTNSSAKPTEDLAGQLLYGIEFNTAALWLTWVQQRMHSTLNYLSPAEFERRWENEHSLAA